MRQQEDLHSSQTHSAAMFIHPGTGKPSKYRKAVTDINMQDIMSVKDGAHEHEEDNAWGCARCADWYFEHAVTISRSMVKQMHPAG